MTGETPRSDRDGPVALRRPGGGVSTEEIAAVLAALTRRVDASDDDVGSDYDRWRDGRVAALRRRPRRG